MDEENISYKPDEYKCTMYKTRKACDSCDGFGRNLDNKINTEECYLSKKKTMTFLNKENEFPRT